MGACVQKEAAGHRGDAGRVWGLNMPDSERTAGRIPFPAVFAHPSVKACEIVEKRRNRLACFVGFAEESEIPDFSRWVGALNAEIRKESVRRIVDSKFHFISVSLIV
jgi:hypothetical protein